MLIRIGRGVDVSLKMVLDGDELLELPYIGERLKKSSSSAPTARGARSAHVLSSQISSGLAPDPLAGQCWLCLSEDVHKFVGSPRLEEKKV